MHKISAKGFTLIEVIISLAILALIASISAASFVSFARREALDSTVSAVAAGLRDARTRTMASINDSQYGVQIDTDRFTLFSNSYVLGATGNEINMLNSRIKMSSSVPSFTFSRISGNSSASGTIDVYVASDPTNRKTINVQGTGLISTQ